MNGYKIFNSLYFMQNNKLSHDGMIHGGFVSIRASYSKSKNNNIMIYMTNISEQYV